MSSNAQHFTKERGFWAGFGSLFDLSPLPGDEDRDAAERDRRATESDREAVGDDMYHALNTYGQQGER